MTKIDRKILLILQPVDPRNGVLPVKNEKLLEFQNLALDFLTDVRIIPQTHKILQIP